MAEGNLPNNLDLTHSFGSGEVLKENNELIFEEPSKEFYEQLERDNKEFREKHKDEVGFKDDDSNFGVTLEMPGVGIVRGGERIAFDIDTIRDFTEGK